jgi:hypothetical protein
MALALVQHNHAEPPLVMRNIASSILSVTLHLFMCMKNYYSVVQVHELVYLISSSVVCTIQCLTTMCLTCSIIKEPMTLNIA